MIDFFKSLWWLMVNAGYLFLILLLSAIALIVPAQAQDFIYVFIQDPDAQYIFWVGLSLLLWCFITWYSASIILQIDPLTINLQSVQANKAHEERLRYFPRWLGVVPVGIMIFAIYKVPLGFKQNQLIYTVCLLAMGVVLFLLFYWLDKRKTAASNPKGMKGLQPYFKGETFSEFPKKWKDIKATYAWPTAAEVEAFRKSAGENKIPTIRQQLRFIYNYRWVRFYYSFFGILAAFLVMITCSPPITYHLALWVKPASVVILGTAFLTFTFTLIAYFHDYANRPFGVGVLVWVIGWSYINDNTAPRYMGTIGTDTRPSVEAAFRDWSQVKWKNWKVNHPGKNMPVVLMSMEGGGIRGINWTVQVLHKLDSQFNGFYDQVFAISGVSGGGVGATHYATFRADQLTNKVGEDGYKNFHRFMMRDFLSPLTAAFLFPDNFQKVIPVAMPWVERSKMLGKTWDWDYEDLMGSNSMASSFLGLWPNDSNRYRIPSLFLNGTLAENGQRVITSNIKTKGSPWFSDDIDYFSYAEKHISVSTAALSCCRFPFITSGCLLESPDDVKGHVIDGGYRENTGLQTLYNIYSSIEDQLLADSVDLIVIYLKNGVDELNADPKPLRILHDIGTPPSGIINVNGTGMPAKGITQFCEQVFGDSIFFQVKLENRKSTLKLPLGWYMSDRVDRVIQNRADSLSYFDRGLMGRLGRGF